MPIRLSIDMLPLGVSRNHAFEGETVKVRTQEFLSSEDGNSCIDRLDGLVECYREVFVPHGPHAPSQVDHFLAIVTRDRDVTTYCNELSLVATIRKQPRVIKKGELVSRNDVVDVERIELRDASGNRIEVPGDCGVAFVFSVGWRKGVYYDYSVFGKGAADRTDDVSRLLGRFYARVLFQDLFSVSEEQWARLIAWGWFPFIGMHSEDRKKLIGWATQDREPIPVFREICEKLNAGLDARIDGWNSQSLLRSHAEFIESARDAYLAKNYIGAIHVLFPRIEGVMRSLHLLKTGDKPKQQAMVKTLIDQRDADSLLLPRRFQEYLLGFYFHGFDEQAGDIPLSRHSVAHGTSRAQDHDFIRATLGFFILDQIFFYLGP